MKKSIKKSVILLLVFSLLSSLVLSGCKKNTNTIAGGEEDINKVPSDTYQIDWYTRGPVQNDVETVEAAVNEYLKDKLNVTLKFHVLDAAQYQKKLSTMISAGEKFDLAYCGGGLVNYRDTVLMDGFFDMAPYMDTYLSDLKEQIDPNFLKGAYVEGKIGGIPCNKEYSAEWGWIYRKDLAEKYGIDMSKIKTLEDLEPYLLKIKENEPEIEYPIEWDASMPVYVLMDFRDFGSDLGVFMDGDTPREEIVILPESEEYLEFCKVTRRFYLEGLVKPDALTATDAAARFKAGKAFCAIYSLKPDAYKEKFPDMKYPIDQVSVTSNIMNSADSAMIGLSSTSENPIRTMRFLNMLYSDPVLSNMMVYGVEGVHYNMTDDGRVEQKPNSGYDMFPYQYMLGNIFMNKLKVGEDAKKHEKLREFNKTAIPFAVGFSADKTDYELERLQVSAVVTEYRNQMTFGVLDPEKVHPEYMKKLKEAGIEKIHKSLSRQYKEYLAAKK